MIYIFAGPTLRPGDVPEVRGVTVLPPVALGDVYRLVEKKPRAIGIIDGFFERTPAVSHKEILWALSNRIPVYGAASMGALRAAELSTFGMAGVGQIYEQYRDGVLEDDDEVAIAHASVAHGYRAASEAMVNIRATILHALDSGILSTADAALLTKAAKDLYYPRRNYPAVIEAAVAYGLKPAVARRFSKWLPGERRDQKREDGRALVALLLGKHPRRKQVDFPFHRTQMWDFAMTQLDSVD